MIYFNNAATSYPKPLSVIDAVNDCLKNPVVHAARTGFERERDDVVYLCRENIAKLFNVKDPLRIIFTSGSTEALNLAIFGLGIENTHVITTAIEHNSVLRPLKTLEKLEKIELTIVDCDSAAYVAPEKIKEAIRDNTSLIVVNHSSNVTGTIIDIQAIAKIAHDAGALILVDASQSAGSFPIDFDGWDIDLMAFTGHKSLYGIQGIGGLCIKNDLHLKPLKIGGTGILSEVLYQPEGCPIHYEAGTPNTPGIVSLFAGTNYIFSEGMEKMHNYKSGLVKTIISELKDVPYVTIYNRTEKSSFTNFCFNIDGMVPEEVGYVLDESYDMIVRTGLHCAPLVIEPLGAAPWGTVRVSPSYFTKEEEIEKFIHAIKDIVRIFKKA